jgi:serine/threonine-protein kinase
MVSDPSVRVVRFGPFALDLRSGQLYKAGLPVRLQVQPFQILALLLERPGELVTREELRQRLWASDTYVDFEHGLNAAVKRLRRALGDSAEAPRFIETIPRRGYRFIAPASELQAEAVPVAAPTPRRRFPTWGAAAAAVALVIGTLILIRRHPDPGAGPTRADQATHADSQGPVRFSIEIEQSGVTAAVNAGGEGLVALCPNGRCVVYRGARDGIGQLYLHSFDRLTSKLLPGTARAHDPFFSPDGLWLGFFADGHLKKISLQTLETETLCTAPAGRGGNWGRNGTILLAPVSTGPIWGVSSNGGAPWTATTLDPRAGDVAHRWPLLLPDGDTLLYGSVDAAGRSRLIAQSLSSGARITLVEHAEYPRYARGHLLFARGDSLRAASFDAEGSRRIGPEVELLPSVSNGKGATGRFDVSLQGTLAYAKILGTFSEDAALVQVDRDGRTSPIGKLRGRLAYPRFSPDGQRLALTVYDSAGPNISIYHVGQESLTRLTSEESHSVCGIWSPDGRRIVYRSKRSTSFELVQQPIDDSGPAETLLTSDHELFPGSWAPDGRTLSFQEAGPLSDNDIGMLSLDQTRGRTRFLDSPHGEWDGVFSPDGRLVAYASIESGRLEVYVRGYPGPGGKRQVSNEGGNSPVWARSGKELFYLNGQKMMVVSVGDGPERPLGTPRLLFEGEYAFAGMLANFDVTPDDRAFVMVREGARSPWMRLNVVLNWWQELERRGSLSQ